MDTNEIKADLVRRAAEGFRDALIAYCPRTWRRGSALVSLEQALRNAEESLGVIRKARLIPDSAYEGQPSEPRPPNWASEDAIGPSGT